MISQSRSAFIYANLFLLSSSVIVQSFVNSNVHPPVAVTVTFSGGKFFSRHQDATTTSLHAIRQRNESDTYSKSQAELNMEELQKAARDPAAFEAYVLNKNKNKSDTDTGTGTNNGEIDAKRIDDSDGEESSQPPKKKNGYVPIEQWDEQREKDMMAWEQKVQFDGQRYGNRFNQNEILRSNLNRF